jgi:TonB-dependent starch-binding outer membrane protein SusC
MKKIKFFYEWDFHCLMKTFRIMRITVFLILCSILQSLATEAYSQRTRFSLDFSETKLADVLDEIETRSEFFFLYNEKLVDTDRKVTQTFRNQRVEEILNILFAETDVIYTITDRKIILAPSYLSQNQQQQNSVSGKVTDDTGQPLPGVTVVIKGTTRGTVTDSNGSYLLSGIEGNATIVFSFVGMKQQETAVSNRTSIDIILMRDFIGLDEVVAIGYGTVKKGDLTGSVAKVNIADIENRVVPRLDEALQGKMAGVMIQSNSAIPGAAPVVRIRGTNSITEGNQPLWVIDGMPIEEAKSIANLNMNDVESIEVLKDAASAAIYGSRGSNGVILVTTKKGKAGASKISYSMYYGTQEAEKRLEMMTGPEAAEVLAERRTWLLTLSNNARFKDLPNDQRPASLRIDPNWLTGNVKGYDFQDYVYRSAPIQNHNISFSGGTDKTTYYASMEYMDNQGIIKNTSFERYSFKINLESQIQSWIKVGLDLAPSFSTQVDNNSEGKDATANAMSRASLLVDQSDFKWNEAGKSWVSDYSVYYDLQGFGQTYRLDNLQQEYKRNQILSRAFIDVNIMNGLSARTQVHYLQSNLKFNDYQTTLLSQSSALTNLAYDYNTNVAWENTLNYVKEIGKHSINGLLGYSQQKDYYEYLSVQGQGFPNDLKLTVNNASRIALWNQDVQEWSMVSMFARAQYNFDSRYMLSASLRRDGSSRFGSDNKWGYFPAVSAGWRISEESFMKDQNLFTILKLRGSYGTTGNNRIGNYRPFATLRSTMVPLGASEALVTGLVPGSFENKKLTWEKTVNTNLGLDAGILDNRVIFALDLYNSTTNDLLLAVPVPLTTGYSSAIQNIGKLSNKGIEVEISTRNIEKRDFKWSTNFNYSYNKNEVKEMGPDGAPILTGPFWAASVSYTGIGYPIGSFYLWEADGIFKTQEEVNSSARYSNEGVGDVKWVDQDGDGKIDAKDRKVMGQPTPKYNFGITNTINYKGFDLSVFINGSGGHQTFFGNYRYISRVNNVTNLKEWVNRWKSPEEPGNGIVPRVTSNAETNGVIEESSAHLYDSDWWRIKNVTLGYNFTASALQRIKISSLRFYVSGDNLFLKTKYPGVNPEGALTHLMGQGTSQRESFSASRDLGYDYGSSPLPKRIIVGLNITF